MATFKTFILKTPPHLRITSIVCWQFIAYLYHKVTTQVQ